MKEDEAKFILNIFTTADGGCEDCTKRLMFPFVKKYPEYEYLAKLIFKKQFSKNYDEVET